jgi:hypothetical protein
VVGRAPKATSRQLLKEHSLSVVRGAPPGPDPRESLREHFASGTAGAGPAGRPAGAQSRCAAPASSAGPGHGPVASGPRRPGTGPPSEAFVASHHAGKGGAGGVMTTKGCSRKSTNLGTPSDRASPEQLGLQRCEGKAKGVQPWMNVAYEVIKERPAGSRSCAYS